jgi:hypothetical protein
MTRVRLSVPNRIGSVGGNGSDRDVTDSIAIARVELVWVSRVSAVAAKFGLPPARAARFGHTTNIIKQKDAARKSVTKNLKLATRSRRTRRLILEFRIDATPKPECVQLLRDGSKERTEQEARNNLNCRSELSQDYLC